jgi:uncharacterized protein
MLIRLEDIPETGLSLDLTEEPGKLVKLAEEGEGAGWLDFSILTPLEAHLDITKTDEGVFVGGTMRAELGLRCSRCLKDFTHELKARFSLYYSTRFEEFEKGGDKELKVADMEVNLLAGGELETTELILAQLSMEVPTQPLCSAECKGLCQMCGADLNVVGCDCKTEERVDSRFASLKGFKVE